MCWISRAEPHDGQMKRCPIRSSAVMYLAVPAAAVELEVLHGHVEGGPLQRRAGREHREGLLERRVVECAAAA